jgi:hypothetical protein
LVRRLTDHGSKGEKYFTTMRELDTKILPLKTPPDILGQVVASLDPLSTHLTYLKLNPMVEVTKIDPSLSPSLPNSCLIQ